MRIIQPLFMLIGPVYPKRLRQSRRALYVPFGWFDRGHQARLPHVHAVV